MPVVQFVHPNLLRGDSHDYEGGNMMKTYCRQHGKLIAFIGCIGFLGIMEAYSTPSGSKNFPVFFNMAFGYVSFDSYEWLMASTIKWIMPQFALLFFWGDYIEDRLVHHLNYILTRTNHLARYVWSVYLKLLAIVVVACVMLYLAAAIVASSQFEHLTLSFSILWNMMTYLLYLYLILLFINVMSISIKAIYSVLIVIGGQLVSLTTTKLIFDGKLPSSLYPFAPTSNVLFSYNQGKLYPAFLLGAAILIVFILNLTLLRRKEVL